MYNMGLTASAAGTTAGTLAYTGFSTLFLVALGVSLLLCGSMLLRIAAFRRRDGEGEPPRRPFDDPEPPETSLATG